MFRNYIFVLSMLCLSTVVAHAAENKIAPVSRITLSTAGLAHFEHDINVSGNQKIDLSVQFSQVDDVLKSLVIFDATGKVGAVSLPSYAALDETFRHLPFTRDDLRSPAALLNAYQGAEVKVSGGAQMTKGRILNAELADEVNTDGDVLKRRIILSLLTDQGIKHVKLETLDAVLFLDQAINRDLARALDAVRANAAQDARTITIALDDQAAAPRPVTIGYVVDSPLWKTAYRMVIPKAGAEKGLLQGWAIVENATGSDWEDVRLTLVSGNPVTFRQALYQSYFVPRPYIPVEIFGRLMPRIDEGSIVASAEPLSARLNQTEKMKKEALSLPSAAMPMMDGVLADRAVAYEGGGGGPASPASSEMMLAGAANVAVSQDVGAQVLFSFNRAYDVKAGESVMLPFVSGDVPMEKLALYQPETNARHPMAAVKIVNDGKSSYPPGILTLFEESESGTRFVGDSQLTMMPMGEQRLIPYALDSKTTIDKSENNQSTEGKLTVSQGVMQTSFVTRYETTYHIKTSDNEARRVVIEQARMSDDMKVIEPKSAEAEKTATHYRFKVDAKAGAVTDFKVVLEQNNWQSIAVMDLPLEELEAYAVSKGELSEEARQSFKKLTELKARLNESDELIARAEEERRVIFENQARIRENLKALDGKSNLKERYLKELDQQEDDLKALDDRIKGLQETREDRHRLLEEAIMGLNITL